MYGFDEKELIKEIDDYFDNKTKEQVLKDLESAGCLHLIEKTESSPYLEGFEIRKISLYNPDYSGNRECECGHDYERHFDSYENMSAVGCKYCRCHDFKPKKENEHVE